MTHFPLPRRRTVRLLVATAVAGALSTVALAPVASAAPAKRTVARADSAVVTSGTTISVKVLANDRTAGKKSRAKVRIVKKSKRLATSVTKSGRIKVRPRASTKPGRYAVTYRVTSRGKSAKAKLRVRVTAKPAPRPTATPAPRPSTPSVPVPTPTPSPTPSPETDPAAPLVPGDTAPRNLHTALEHLTVAEEVREGYDRDDWKHWNVGANPTDGCNTRSEVLIAESLTPVSGAKCPITTANNGGGSWFSYYDGATTTAATTFDIDHMVPLAEAHDSGGWAWDAATREAYANDLGDPRSLIAVSASSNRSKSDGDPAEWLPEREVCRYVSEWIAVKVRWSLSVDPIEQSTLSSVATSQCRTTTVAIIWR